MAWEVCYSNPDAQHASARIQESLPTRAKSHERRGIKTKSSLALGTVPGQSLCQNHGKSHSNDAFLLAGMGQVCSNHTFRRSQVTLGPPRITRPITVPSRVGTPSSPVAVVAGRSTTCRTCWTSVAMLDLFLSGRRKCHIEINKGAGDL